jgi:signal transduction histidine kinase
VDLPRLTRRYVVALDVALAALLVALGLYSLTQPWDDGFRAHAGWLDIVAVTGMIAPFALRTAAPRLALGLVLVVNAVTGAIGPHSLLFYAFFPPLLVLIYAVARHDDGWAGRVAWGTAFVLILGNIGMPAARAPSNWVFTAILSLAAWGVGRVSRRVARQSEQLSVALARLRLERAAGERQAVELERTRIAADMHDVVGHALSLMVLQTGAARAELAARAGEQAAEQAAEQAEGQLRAAETAGRAALDELRRTLGLLRRVPPPMEVDTSPR